MRWQITNQGTLSQDDKVIRDTLKRDKVKILKKKWEWGKDGKREKERETEIKKA